MTNQVEALAILVKQIETTHEVENNYNVETMEAQQSNVTTYYVVKPNLVQPKKFHIEWQEVESCDSKQTVRQQRKIPLVEKVRHKYILPHKRRNKEEGRMQILFQ